MSAKWIILLLKMYCVGGAWWKPQTTVSNYSSGLHKSYDH